MDNQLIFITILFLVLILLFFFVNGRENFYGNTCDTYLDEVGCNTASCKWNGTNCIDNISVTPIPTCDTYLDENNCNNAYCKWNNGDPATLTSGFCNNR